MKTIVLGGGCFWCTEAVYQRVRGVSQVVSGFAGGGTEDTPDYWSIHGPNSNHAEVIEVTYDPGVLSLETIFDIFFHTHDPTTLQQPGTADKGEEYRSIILCDQDEIEVAEKAKEIAQADWNDPIITEIKELDAFHPAEDVHQDFYNRNRDRNPYCQAIIDPKLAKFYERYAELTKDD